MLEVSVLYDYFINFFDDFTNIIKTNRNNSINYVMADNLKITFHIIITF